MTENRFTPPEAQSFKAHPENRPTDAEAVAPVTEESEKPLSAADNLPANFELKLKKLTRDFAFSEDPQAQDFLRLASQVNNLSNANLSEEKLAALKTALSQALDKAENAFATNTNMFAQVLSAFDNSPQEFKRAYLQKQKNSANSEGFSSYLQTTYQRTKLRRLRDVYLGLLVKLQQYENTQTPVMAVAEESAVVGGGVASNESVSSTVVGKSAGSDGEAPVSITGEQGVIDGRQHLGVTVTSNAGGSSEVVGTGGPTEGDNQTTSSAAEGGSNIASFENNSFKSENSSADSGNIAAGSGSDGATPPESPSFGDAEGDNGDFLRNQYETLSFNDDLAKIKALLKQLIMPSVVSRPAVENYYKQLNFVQDLFDAFTLTYHDMGAKRAQFSGDYGEVKRLLEALNKQSNCNFKEKCIEIPLMYVDKSVMDLAKSYQEYFAKSDDPFVRTDLLDKAKNVFLPKAKEFMATLNRRNSVDLQIYDYVAGLVQTVTNERIIPDKDHAIEVLRTKKSFKDVMEWLYDNRKKVDFASLEKALVYIKKVSLSDYDNRLAEAEKTGNTEVKEKIQKARAQAEEYIQVLWNNCLAGNFADGMVSMGDGRDNDGALLNYITGSTAAEPEKFNNDFNSMDLFRTKVNLKKDGKIVEHFEHFDWVTQGNREGVAGVDNAPTVGVLQDVIHLMYKDHLTNRDSEFSYENMFFNKTDPSIKEGTAMDALIDEVIGKDIAELEQKYHQCKSDADNLALDETTRKKAEKNKAIYQRINEELKYHSADMFNAFKLGIKYKVARDNLTELASYQSSAENTASLPNYENEKALEKALKKGSFGVLASAVVQLARFRSGQPSEAPKILPLLSTVYDISGVVNGLSQGITDETRREKYIKDRTEFITKYKVLNEGVYYPQLKDLLFTTNQDEINSEEQKGNVGADVKETRETDIAIKLDKWWQGGVPPKVFAMNSGKPLKAWVNAENAMMDMLKIASASITRYNDGRNADNYMINQRKLNTDVSIINAYVGSMANLEGDNSQNAINFWRHRNKILARNDGSLDYVAINATSLYLIATIFEVMSAPKSRRTYGRSGTVDEYDAETKEKLSTIIKGLGEDGEALKKPYLYIVKDYYQRHGEIKGRRYFYESSLDRLLGRKDRRNDFMAPQLANRYTYSLFNELTKRYKESLKNTYPAEYEKYTSGKADSLVGSFFLGPGVTPDDVEASIHLIAVPLGTPKITEKDNL